MREINDYCDRCKTLIRNTGDRCNYPLRYTETISEKGLTLELDLCFSCGKALEKFLKQPTET
jgi:hypothetical protein